MVLTQIGSGGPSVLPRIPGAKWAASRQLLSLKSGSGDSPWPPEQKSPGEKISLYGPEAGLKLGPGFCPFCYL